MTREYAYKMRDILHKATKSLNNDDALEAIELFPLWKAGDKMMVDSRVRYADKLYRVVQEHTAQSDWTPPLAPALFVEVVPDGVIPVWVRPTGAHDAYHMGDKVHYPAEDSPVYQSTIDANVWSPEEYPQGWEVVDE